MMRSSNSGLDDYANVNPGNSNHRETQLVDPPGRDAQLVTLESEGQSSSTDVITQDQSVFYLLAGDAFEAPSSGTAMPAIAGEAPDVYGASGNHEEQIEGCTTTEGESRRSSTVLSPKQNSRSQAGADVHAAPGRYSNTGSVQQNATAATEKVCDLVLDMDAAAAAVSTALTGIPGASPRRTTNMEGPGGHPRPLCFVPPPPPPPARRGSFRSPADLPARMVQGALPLPQQLRYVQPPPPPPPPRCYMRTVSQPMPQFRRTATISSHQGFLANGRTTAFVTGFPGELGGAWSPEVSRWRVSVSGPTADFTQADVAFAHQAEMRRHVSTSGITTGGVPYAGRHSASGIPQLLPPGVSPGQAALHGPRSVRGLPFTTLVDPQYQQTLPLQTGAPSLSSQPLSPSMRATTLASLMHNLSALHHSRNCQVVHDQSLQPPQFQQLQQLQPLAPHGLFSLHAAAQHITGVAQQPGPTITAPASAGPMPANALQGLAVDFAAQDGVPGPAPASAQPSLQGREQGSAHGPRPLHSALLAARSAQAAAAAATQQSLLQDGLLHRSMQPPSPSMLLSPPLPPPAPLRHHQQQQQQREMSMGLPPGASNHTGAMPAALATQPQNFAYMAAIAWRQQQQQAQQLDAKPAHYQLGTIQQQTKSKIRGLTIDTTSPHPLGSKQALASVSPQGLLGETPACAVSTRITSRTSSVVLTTPPLDTAGAPPSTEASPVHHILNAPTSTEVLGVAGSETQHHRLLLLLQLCEEGLVAAMADVQDGRGLVSLQQLHDERSLLHAIGAALLRLAGVDSSAKDTAGGRALGPAAVDGSKDAADWRSELYRLSALAAGHTAKWPEASGAFRHGLMVLANALVLLYDTYGSDHPDSGAHDDTVVGCGGAEHLAGARGLLCSLAARDETLLAGLVRLLPVPEPPQAPLLQPLQPSPSSPPPNGATVCGAAPGISPADGCSAGGPKPRGIGHELVLAQRLLLSLCDMTAAVPPPDVNGGSAARTRNDDGHEGVDRRTGADAEGPVGMALLAIATECGHDTERDSAPEQMRLLGRSLSAPAHHDQQSCLLSRLFSSFDNRAAGAPQGATNAGEDGREDTLGGLHAAQTSHGPGPLPASGSGSANLNAAALAQLLGDDGHGLFGAAAVAALGGGGGGGCSNRSSDCGGASPSLLACYLGSFAGGASSSMSLSSLLESSGSLDFSGLSLLPTPRTSPQNPLAMRAEFDAALAAGAGAAGGGATTTAVSEQRPAGLMMVSGSAQVQRQAATETPGRVMGHSYKSPHLDLGAVPEGGASLAEPYADFFAAGAGELQGHHVQGQQQYLAPHCSYPLEAATQPISDVGPNAFHAPLGSGALEMLQWDNGALSAALRILQYTSQLDG